MGWSMEVNLIKRGKVIHCGLALREFDRTYKVSLCSGVWNCNDKTSVGDSNAITCKRCLRIIATADANGVVTLPNKRRAY